MEHDEQPAQQQEPASTPSAMGNTSEEGLRAEGSGLRAEADASAISCITASRSDLRKTRAGRCRRSVSPARRALPRKRRRCGAKPDVVWHSGKLRAKQTAQEFWRACNALAEFAVTKICSPTIRRNGSATAFAAKRATSPSPGIFTHLPRLLALLTTGGEAGVDFPINGIVALVTDDEGETYRELWRIEN